MMTVGERIDRSREAIGISQRELGRRAGVSGSFLSMVVNGQSMPSVETLHRISAVLGVRVGWLLDGIDGSWSLAAEADQGGVVVTATHSGSVIRVPLSAEEALRFAQAVTGAVLEVRR